MQLRELHFYPRMPYKYFSFIDDGTCEHLLTLHIFTVALNQRLILYYIVTQYVQKSWLRQGECFDTRYNRNNMV